MNIFFDSKRLYSLISDYPKLPLVFHCADYGTDEDYMADRMSSHTGEVLDTEGPDDEKCYTDRDELADDIAYNLGCEDEYSDLPDEEFEAVVEEKAREYDKYWKPCIIVELQ